MTLLLVSTAQIKGPVTAGNVSVAGSIHGDVTADGEVTIRESGQIHGNITAHGLVIVSGGIFIGTNKMSSDKVDKA